MAKRALSFLLCFMMLVTVFSGISINSTAATVKTVLYDSPAILCNVGERISLSQYSVQTSSTTTASASSIVWRKDGSIVTSITPSEAGVTALTATANGTKYNVYVVAKNASDTEYVLYSNDFDGTKQDLLDDGWQFLSGINATVSNGQLHLGSKDVELGRAILPSYLSDFAAYSITAVASQTDVLNASRWCSIVYHCENANGAYYPYYHICVRNNTTSSTIEFAERTSSNQWNVISNKSMSLNMSTGFHQITVNAYSSTVQYLLDGESVFYTSGATAHTKGYVGLTSNYGIMNVESIRITILETAPERPEEKASLINTNSNREDTEITTYISNQGYATKDTFSTIVKQKTVAVLLDLSKETATQAEFETYLKQCSENNKIPEFKLSTTAQVDLLNQAVTATGVPEAVVVSESDEVVKYARTKNKLVLRGTLDYSSLASSKLTEDQLFEIAQKTAGCYAEAVILPAKLAKQEYVSYLRLKDLSVWVMNQNLTTETEAAWLISSGATVIVTNQPEEITKVENEYYTDTNSVTRTPIWTAHRGLFTTVPENSMASFKKAMENGADRIEIDIHLTKDNVVVICHDDTIDRTSNGSGTIASMTYEEISQYRLLSNGKVTDEKIPTFEELLQYCKDKDICILVELKSAQANLCKYAYELISKYDMEDQVGFISFYPAQNTKMKTFMSTSTGNLNGSCSVSDGTDIVGTLNALYALFPNTLGYHSTMAINYGGISNEFIRDSIDRSITMFTWTYSNSVSSLVCQYFLAGMDGMTTNNIDYLKNTVKAVSAQTSYFVKPGSSVAYSFSSETYLGTVTDITKNASTKVIMIDNDGVITADQGTITGLKEGTASFMLSFQTKLPNGTSYTMYSQPITVTVSNNLNVLTLTDSSAYQVVRDQNPVDETLSEKLAIVTKVLPDTSVETFKSNFINGSDADIYASVADYNTQKGISDSKLLVGTGAVAQLGNDQAHIIIIKGDISPDGKVTAKDYLMLKRSVLGTYSLSEIQTLASDINDDGDVSAKDYLMLKRYVLGTYNIY